MDSGQKAKQISYATDQRLDITFILSRSTLTGMQMPPFYEFGLSRPSQLRFIWLRFGLASAMMFTVACGHSRLS
jgi:hypothetical protein